MHACVLDGPPFTGASDTARNLIDYQQYAVAIADAAQFLHEHRGRDDVSAFALHRLHEDCCYFLGRERSLEQLVFNEAGTAQCEGFGILRTAFASAIHIGITNVRHAWNHWAEATLLLRLGGSKRKRAHGASVKRPKECDHVLPLGVIAGQFEGTLNGFRT